MSVALGTRYVFGPHTFRNAAGTATDPTTIKFFMREEVDGTELEWTYNAAAVEGTHYPVGMQPIVKNGTGIYQLSYDARKPERVSGALVGTGTVVESVPFTLFVRHSDIETLDDPSS